MSDLAKFYRLTSVVQEGEAAKTKVLETLKTAYKELVVICPHSEAIDFNFGNHSGDYRVCKICGLEDLASEGGIPGDEYNYGFPGRPNKEFWKGANVVRAKDADEFWSYRRGHHHQVVDGKVKVHG